MILVDTSAWISFFNKPQSAHGIFLENLIQNREPLCINSLIELEILQGVRDDSKAQSLKTTLRPYLYFHNFSYRYFEKASEIFRACRKKGITIRRSSDCLIAANAILDKLVIFHYDRDFDNMKKVFPDLKCIGPVQT